MFQKYFGLETVLINFKLFSVSQIFERKAKDYLKRKSKALGRMWSIEINGTGKGCGLIAADDKIRIWRQK